MTDEVDIYTKLESSLYGSLVHAVTVSAPILQADATAVRVFDSPHGLYNTYYVDTRGVEGDSTGAASLAEWPVSTGSVFEVIREQWFRDQSLGPRRLIHNGAVVAAGHFQPFDVFTTVTDTLCVAFPVTKPAWAALVYLRCDPHGPFTDDLVNALDRFRPALVRVILHGYRREILGLSAGPGPAQGQGLMTPAPSPTTLLATLSRTERLVLNYLRSEATEKQIAETIHRSPHTVHVHVKNIYRKLGVNSRRMLMCMFDQYR